MTKPYEDADETRRDEVLKRMLGMAPKPHAKDEREPGKPIPRRASEEEAKEN